MMGMRRAGATILQNPRACLVVAAMLPLAVVICLWTECKRNMGTRGALR